MIDVEQMRVAQEELVDEELTSVSAAHPEVRVDKHVEVGAAVTTIVDAAKDSELVVVGSKGAGAFAAFVLGSIAHGVAHRSKSPTVLVPDGHVGTAIGRIVVGSDGSPAAQLALQWAQREAAVWNADLDIVHVWDYPYAPTKISDLSAEEQMERDAEALLAEAANAFANPALAEPGRGGRVDIRLLRGSPGQTLVEAAAGADLLVVGARGRGALRSAVLGSTSSYAIHHAVCPIAVIHAPTSDA